MAISGRIIRISFMALTAWALSLPAQASPASPWHQAADYQQLVQGVSLKAAIQQAQQMFGGRVVRANTVERSGSLVHRIRLVNQGRVRDVLIDAASGDVIRPTGQQGDK